MASSIEIINSLRNEFIQEAQSAPKLFKDLAKVEQYIAESYKSRSLIELIQNADDAQSTVFGVHELSNGLIVANNGRTFTLEDVEALCRSGSSHKFRGGSTIGYRGIGFKSVVNLAERIHVFSGEFAFYYEKAATKKLLSDIPDAPLVRIPHPYLPDINDNLLKEVDVLKKRYKYTTIFIFLKIHKRIAAEELSEFDRNSLLFMNNITHVMFALENTERAINIEKKSVNNKILIKIMEADHIDEWDILRSESGCKDMVAFKYSNDSIIPALPEESVIHSFTPTIEFAGAYLKINGDYSTDPSRKSIDMDKSSQRSFSHAVSLIVDVIACVLENKVIKKGFFKPFVNITGREGSKFRGLLFKSIAARLNERILNINGKETAFSSIRLRPDWFNYEDYEKSCHTNIMYLNKELVTLYPELPVFLEQLGVKKLYLDEVIGKVNSTKLSTTGAAQIGVKIINQYRYDLNKNKVDRIKKLKIFPVKGKLVSADEIESIDEVNQDFADYIFNNTDKHDIKPFFSKLCISAESKIKSDADTYNNAFDNPESSNNQVGREVKSPSSFKAIPNIQKWRSAEKNSHEYLQSLNGVLNVTDVSNANMGYDLEVLLANGKKMYVEIKSVSSFSEPVKITNNEYSSAHNYGKSYYLAVVINEEPFQIKLISDPIKTLSFQKQIERWSWFCDSYREELREAVDLLVSHNAQL